MESSENDEKDNCLMSDLLRDPRHLWADLRMLRRAIRERWPVITSRKTQLMARLAAVLAASRVEDSQVIQRAQLTAVECAIVAERRNVEELFRALESREIPVRGGSRRRRRSG